MTPEIDLTSLHPPRPYDPRLHIHTGPVVIVTTTDSLWIHEYTTRLSSNNTWSDIFFFYQSCRCLVHLMNRDTQEWRECVVIMFLHCLIQTVFTTPVNSVPCYSTKRTRTLHLLMHSSMQCKGQQHLLCIQACSVKGNSDCFAFKHAVRG